jgi:hypothetical protein
VPAEQVPAPPPLERKPEAVALLPKLEELMPDNDAVKKLARALRDE